MNKKQGISYAIFEDVLRISKNIWYVTHIDSGGRIILEKHHPNVDQSFCDASKEYVLDLCISKKMLEIFNEPFGEPMSVLITRKRARQIIFYHNSLITYVFCNPSIEEKEMYEIMSKINRFIRELPIE